MRRNQGGTPRWWLPLSLVLIIAACSHGASERTPAVQAPAAPTAPPSQENIIAQQVRLFEVSYPLLRAARTWCKDATLHGMGLFALNRHALGRHESVAWQYGIDDRLRVLATSPGSPATRAGLMAGDIILSVGGAAAPTTATATRTFGAQMNRIAIAGAPVEVTVLRDTETINKTVALEPLCGYQVHVSETPQVNALTDGRRTIQITRGMLGFARTQPELAMVVAHEIAHNALGHLAARAQFMKSIAENGAAAPKANINGMTPAFSQALEMEADHLALYILARAGFAPGDAPAFIARLGGGGARNLQVESHPAGAARVAAVRKTIAEIERKRARGLPLVP